MTNSNPEKECTGCKITKPLTDFYRNHATRDGRQSRCKQCEKLRMQNDPERRAKNNALNRAWERNNRDRVAARHKKRSYGLTIEQFEAMRQQQGDACAICRKPFTKRICIDHCHASGAVRALLCNSCNSGLGNFSDDTNLMRVAIEYIEKHRA
jgi:hypothetical protein